MNSTKYRYWQDFCTRWGIDWRFDLIENPIQMMWELINAMNKMGYEVEEIKKEMLEFINRFGEDLDHEVRKILIEWHNDGTLENIINDVLLNNINNKVDIASIPNHVNVKREFRTMWDRTDQTINMRLQGMTFDGDYFYMAFIPMEDKDQKDATVRKFDRNGNIVAEVNVIDGQHANSMTIVDDNIWIATSTGVDKLVIILDKNLNELNRLTCEVEVAAMSYKDGEIWTLGDEVNVIKIIDKQGRFKRSIKLHGYDLNSATVGQGIYVDDFIYRVKSNPNTIYVYTLEGLLIRKMDMLNMFTVKEYEDIECVDGVFYVNYHSALNYSNWVTGIGSFTFDNNLIKRSTMIGENDTTIEVNVDNNLKINNPDGSKAKPFKEIQEALDYLMNFNNIRKYIRIHKSNKVYNYFRVWGHDNISIVGIDNPTVNGFDVTSTSRVAIQSLHVSNNGRNKYMVGITDSTVRLSKLTFEKHDYQIKIDFNSHVQWTDVSTTLEESSVSVGVGSRFNLTKKQAYNMLYPVDTSWLCDVPISLWTGDQKSGVFNLRNKIDLNNFRYLHFRLSTGDIITVDCNIGNFILRTFYMSNTEDNIDSVIAHWNGVISKNSVSLTDPKGIVMNESGNKKTNPSYRILSIYGS